MLVEDQDVEFGVVSLPHGVRVLCAPPVDQFVLVSQGGRAVVGEGHHRWVEAGNDGAHRTVGRDRPALIRSDPACLALDGRDRTRRPVQGQTFDHRHQLGRRRSATPVTARAPGQPDKPASSVLPQPALHRAQRGMQIGRV